MKELRETINVTNIELGLMGAPTDISGQRKLNGTVLRSQYNC